MGVSEVLLCPYRCLEYKMERLEKQGLACGFNPHWTKFSQQHNIADVMGESEVSK